MRGLLNQCFECTLPVKCCYMDLDTLFEAMIPIAKQQTLGKSFNNPGRLNRLVRLAICMGRKAYDYLIAVSSQGTAELETEIFSMNLLVGIFVPLIL